MLQTKTKSILIKLATNIYLLIILAELDPTPKPSLAPTRE